jgi:cytochrome c556
MRVAVLTALATVSLLSACRQPETQAHNSLANDTAAPAANSAISAIPAAAPISAEQAQQLFHERHEGMEKVGKANKAIRQQLESGSPDLAVLRSSAATISDLAAKSSGWFPAGTGQEVLRKTRALPAIWQKREDFEAKDRDFNRAARALKDAAERGDMNAIKSRFADLGKTCKACHDTYRAEEHPK